MTTNNQGVGTRELALIILLEIERGEKSHIVLRQVLEKYQYLSKQDRAFLTRLAEGTTERRIELDYIINQFSKVKTEKMKPVIRNILRCAVYQIKYMDQVPDSAACNEAVNLATRKGFKNLRGFVNGVLRNIARNIDKIAYPENTEEFLSIKYSMPQWIIRMWVRDYGEEKTKYILKGFYKERATTIRINGNATSKEELIRELTGEGIQVKEHPLLASALLISGYDYLAAIPAFREGKFQVQDAASIMVAEQAGIKEGDYILDVCAAPGGKALHAAQVLNGTGMVEARDLTEMKVELIRENISRMGFENIRAVQQDATCFDADSEEKADVLIADLPCSGLGVMRRKTDIKYKMTLQTEQELVSLQRNMLETVCQYVKVGGTLLYSTCTMDKMENEDNVTWFLKQHPQFELVKMQQIFPQKTYGDGFFLAKLQKKA